MAFPFPLTTAQFFQLLPIRELTFDIPEAMEMSETGGGEILTADLGTRLWRGEVQLGDMEPDEAAEVLPLFDVLRRSGASFMVYDVGRPAPRADLTGSIIAGYAPRLHSVSSGGREIRISSLPPGYELRRHDYVAFSYGASPTRFALHRLASGALASGAGLTPLFEVSPNLRPGWALNADVTLVRASCKAILVPGSFRSGRRKARLTTGAGFQFVQTLR